jgi:hypothetical protein
MVRDPRCRSPRFETLKEDDLARTGHRRRQPARSTQPNHSARQDLPPTDLPGCVPNRSPPAGWRSPRASCWYIYCGRAPHSATLAIRLSAARRVTMNPARRGAPTLRADSRRRASPVRSMTLAPPMTHARAPAVFTTLSTPHTPQHTHPAAAIYHASLATPRGGATPRRRPSPDLLPLRGRLPSSAQRPRARVRAPLACLLPLPLLTWPLLPHPSTFRRWSTNTVFPF